MNLKDNKQTSRPTTFTNQPLGHIHGEPGVGFVDRGGTGGASFGGLKNPSAVTPIASAAAPLVFFVPLPIEIVPFLCPGSPLPFSTLTRLFARPCVEIPLWPWMDLESAMMVCAVTADGVDRCRFPLEAAAAPAADQALGGEPTPPPFWRLCCCWRWR